MPSKFAAHSYSIFDCFPRNGSTNENKETAAEFLLKRQCFIVNRFLMEWLTNFHSILNIVYVFSLKESIQLIETPVQSKSCSGIFFLSMGTIVSKLRKKKPNQMGLNCLQYHHFWLKSELPSRCFLVLNSRNSLAMAL